MAAEKPFVLQVPAEVPDNITDGEELNSKKQFYRWKAHSVTNADDISTCGKKW